MINKDTSILDLLPNNKDVISATELAKILAEPPFSIEVKRKDEFILFKYDQIESDFSYKIVQNCRGIIAHEPSAQIVCYPFRKFFNAGEGQAAKVDWSTAEVQEKLDGSILKRWWWDGEWHTSTNGMIDAADAHVSGGDSRSFLDLFKEVNLPEYNLDDLDKDSTHMFELVHPESRVIIHYDKPTLFYLGSRKHGTWQEYKHENIVLPRPKTYKFNSLEETVEMAKALPFNEEGYVVVDANFNRVKVKSPAYVAVNHLRLNGVITERRVLRVLLANESPELLVYFPELTEIFNKVKNALAEYIDKVWDEWEDVSKIGLSQLTRKEFAILHATKLTNPHVMFKLYDNPSMSKEDVKKLIYSFGDEKLSQMLKLEN